jgi:Zn-dependent M28 family amino/carboxypeptidase
MKKIVPALLLAAMILGYGCGPRTEKPKEEAKKKAVLIVPPFNADSAYQFVADQVAFGPRVVGTPAHQKCLDFLVKKLKSYTKDVTVQNGQAKAYNGTTLKFQNIIASFGPEGSNRIILASHWDSRPYADNDPDPKNFRTPIDGANDGASGVGILLEVARQLSLKSPSVGVDIVFFDAEDYGPPMDLRSQENNEDAWGLGSQYFSRHPFKPGYLARFGILLDMVGAKNATFLMEGKSLDYAPDVMRSVWDIANELGYSAYFIYNRGADITDDHIYVNEIMNIPMIDIIHLDRSSQTGFYPYWHTTGDKLDKIDPTTLDVVGKTLMAVIANPQ